MIFLSSDLSLPACCCSLFADKIFFCQGATAGYDKLDKKGYIYIYYSYYWKASWESLALGKWGWKVYHDGTASEWESGKFESSHLLVYFDRLF